jgi:hypothetical protein
MHQRLIRVRNNCNRQKIAPLTCNWCEKGWRWFMTSISTAVATPESYISKPSSKRDRNSEDFGVNRIQPCRGSGADVMQHQPHRHLRLVLKRPMLQRQRAVCLPASVRIMTALTSQLRQKRNKFVFRCNWSSRYLCQRQHVVGVE